MTEKRYVLAVAYQAGRDDRIIKGVDGHRDYFSPDELEQAAWAFMKSSREVGLFHVPGTTGAGEVVESYVYRGPPWQQADGSVIKAGDWLVGVICDEVAWSLVKAGKVTGFSPQGGASRRRRPL